MRQRVILADDFTGAHDVGLPFAVSGFKTVVINSPEHLASIEADIIVIDTGSRNCSETEATQRLQKACCAIKEQNADLIYKKVDSTLRGHIGAEIACVQRMLGQRATILCPAFPALGRTTVGGYHLLDGIPVDQTATGRDLESPVTTACLPDLIRSQTSLNVYNIDLKIVSAGEGAIKEALNQSPTASLVVLDAATPEHIKNILAAVDVGAQDTLICGSAGLAGSMADYYCETPDSTDPPYEEERPSAGPVLTIAGSVNPVSVQQVAVASNIPEIEVLYLDLNTLLSDNSESEIIRVADTALSHLVVGSDVVIALAPNSEDRIARDDKVKASGGDCSLVVYLADCFGEITKILMGSCSPSGLVLTGGETAERVVQHLGSHGARLTGQIMDGVASAVLLGGPYQDIPLVLKPGGFGDPDGLITCIKHLHASDAKATAVIGDRPILGITIGDPNGVGPEVIVKALTSPELYRLSRPLVIGNAEVMRRHLDHGSVPLEINRVNTPAEGKYTHGVLDVLTVDKVDVDSLKHGEVQESAGRLAAGSVVAATKLAMAHDIQAVVTAPLNKEAMNLAGYHYPGHTELIAELTGTKQYRLTLAFDEMLVSHVTTHVSLREAIKRLSEEGVVSTIEIIGNALKRMGIKDPQIAVMGLNPHAGEGGMFGDEEIRIIEPAVKKARMGGWNIQGPLPPDTVFLRALRGEFNGIVGMYHDQGHIPVKAIAFDRSINVSLGLPIIRTSVDHGTAFDIAGQGIANSGNLDAAIRMAVRLVGDSWSVEVK
ncbi:MAG: 4-hydroxythreonine-4-phosphate dehydrogenase PdxA [Gemmatimonadota bacterium]|nr:4-hydroxythreonine-4-phosphate dehydrogenase PdxA [Gemmatimonadota bacterium]